MRRATPLAKVRHCEGYVFLSTLSLRRATFHQPTGISVIGISIHALLAESDGTSVCMCTTWRTFLSTLSLRRATWKYCMPTAPRYFYPRSPCGERPGALPNSQAKLQFLSTLSLRRATITGNIVLSHILLISIHALLAESDFDFPVRCGPQKDFYPRSPCGERQIRDSFPASSGYFYPRSPCGERPEAYQMV